MNAWLRRSALLVGVVAVILAIMVGNQLLPKMVDAIRYRMLVDANPYGLKEGQAEYLRKTYGKKAREILYRTVPRSLVLELEPILEEFLPLFKPIPGLNLTTMFPKGGLDTRLQQQANSSNLTAEDFRTLNFYETVRTYHVESRHSKMKRRFKKYAKYRVPARATGIFGDEDQWKLTSGRLVHQRLLETDVPWYWWPVTWFNASYQKPTIIRFVRHYGVKITGLFYYPPGGYASWHTNQFDDIGWRFYYIRTTTPGKSWFRYKHVLNDTVHLAPDGEEHYNMFYLTGDKDDLIWHSVYSDTNRFSVGFRVPSMFVYLIPSRLHNDTTFSDG
jgi:hypothetical protein